MINKRVLAFLCSGILLLLVFPVFAQQTFKTIQGTVAERRPGNVITPMVGARVFSDKKHQVLTDADGNFSLLIPDTVQRIWIRAGQDRLDSATVPRQEQRMRIVFPQMAQLNDVVITQHRFSTEISLLPTIKTERIGARELLKAACCNLSESFETTPSVDVAFTDAITGYKQIQLLGLAGPYTLITRENIPEVRGLAAVTGLSFTPGPWIQNMQLSKGTGSVVNGYEGLAGQINVELQKPMEGDRFLLNLYQSAQGRSEFNAIARFEPKKQVYGNLMVHGKYQWLAVDQNHDHYLDQLIGHSGIISNRWIGFTKKGLEWQLGVKGITQKQYGGSMHYDGRENPATASVWGLQQTLNRYDAWAKFGKIINNQPWKSMGLQLAVSNQHQNHQFGRRNYTANEKTAYANYIYQTILGSTLHVLKMGATAQYSLRHETVLQTPYHTQEFSGGVFTEYTHTFSSAWNAVFGFRTDYNNLYGVYTTPRMHVRFAPNEHWAWRMSVGKAYRSPAIWAENPGVFAGNRIIDILASQPKGAYTLGNEQAWNTGLNATYKFKFNYRPGTLSADYYYTHFIQQVVVDYENPRAVLMYTSREKSYAHSMQVQLDYELKRKWDLRLAYRYHNVRMQYQNGFLPKALNAPHRAFINTAYHTHSQWSFDATLQWTGPKRIPSTAGNPDMYQLPTTSPSFLIANAHINKTIKKQWDIYAGVENLFNTMQTNMILGASDPFGPYFDAALVWGPAMGRTLYMGMRWRLPEAKPL
jgi:outer membrane receptor for ferrienterochelin and colicin